jgi:type IX secretion system PorP/SprF family membrane protein
LQKKLYYSILFFLLSLTVSGQDPQFTQFYANPLYLGPSFAGAVEGSRIAGQYRNQWTAMPAAFTTYSFSFDHYFKTFKSGVGVNLIQDVAGTSKLGVFQAGLHYSYNFKIYNVWYIRPGISFSYLQHGIFGETTFIYQFDNSMAQPGSPTFKSAKDIDASSSLLVYTNGFWLGGTVDHLLTPNVALYYTENKIPIKTSIYGGIDLRKRGRLLKPSDDVMTFAFLYKNQGPYQQLDLGVYWYNYPWVMGLWYRGLPMINSQFGDAVVFLFGMKFLYFNVGYSYDFTVSSMLQYTRGSHEISATYKFNVTKRKKKGGVPCPEF